MEERRWTIEACLRCGAQAGDPPTECHSCEVSGDLLQEVEVMPVSEHQQLRDSLAEAVAGLWRKAEACRELAGQCNDARRIAKATSYEDAASRLTQLLDRSNQEKA